MNKIFVATFFLSLNLLAAEPQFGRIVDLKGEGFISFKGKTREIKKGEAIEVGSEIVIEHHGQVTFTDNADHRFHLGNASSASVTATEVELRAGDLWFQSLNKNDNYKIKTANATVDYTGGEGILTYDSVKGKSQLMVINGMMKISNLRQNELNLNVSEGHFSFIDNAYDEGAPRDPTPVGEKTYGQLVALFHGVSPMDKNSIAIFKDHDKHEEKNEEKHETKREIASVPEIEKEAEKEVKKEVESVEKHKKVVAKRAAPKKIAVEKMIVHIYGQTTSATVAHDSVVAPALKSRAPASVPEVAPVGATAEPAPYSKQYKESDKLIDDLKKL